MFRFLKKFTKASRSQYPTTSRRHSFRPAIEGLEDRQMLSVSSLWFSGSTLVVATNNAATTVTVNPSGTNIVIKEGTTGPSWSYAASSVGRVEFQGGAGNDRFVNNVYSLPITAYGFGGNDYLEGYNGNDQFIGGDGDDTMVGYGGNDSFWGGNGNDLIKGMTGNDTAYGNAGDDRIIGGDGNDYLCGDDGYDAIIGNAGTDSLYGGNGDDSLVAIDNGVTDYCDGQAGMDTIWVDANLVWSGLLPLPKYDTAYGEKVQTVFAFANGADRTLDGDAIADPTDGTFYKNFSSKPLFGAGGPSVNDIDQEALADCWLLAPLGSIANDHPYAIRQMVADFGDGTYGVRLGNNFYRVDADLPTWNALSTDQCYAGLGQDGALWVPLVEKAYASYRTGANTFASLNWGDPADALRAYNATAVGENYYAAGSSSTTVANDVFNHWNAFQSCTICTGSVPSGSPLVGSHCYSVYSVSRNSSGVVTSITVRNPWGPDGTGGNPFVVLTPAQLAACQIWVAWGNT